MRTVLVSLIAIAAATAQEAGRIEGVVLDAASHQPIKKATVSVNLIGEPVGGFPGGGAPGSGQSKNEGPQTVTTDSSGTFTFSNLAAGQYQLTVMHQNYPEARMGGTHKNVRVSVTDPTPSVTVELTPGAAVSGHIVDEDGDPLDGCMIQPHPAKNINGGVPMMRVPMTHEDGSYRLFGIPPGKYIITAQCSASVFQPRPLSEGPDPPPSAAYPLQYYPAASDVKSAETIELSAGAEKSGVDFQMRPVAVTHLHGTLVAGSADWRGRNDLRIQLVPIDNGAPRIFGFAGGQINLKDGSFELRQVFPGSYRLMVFSQEFSANPLADASNRVGAVARVDVGTKPVELSLQLHAAMDISGKVEIERGPDTSNSITPSQINIRLIAEPQFGLRPPPAQVNDDGSFTIKSVLPGEWRIRLFASSAFLKSAWLGADEVMNRTLDLSSGVAAPLRIVVSTDTAKIKGTGPAGQVVFFVPVDQDETMPGWQLTQVDSNGQFAMAGLAPGKYRIVVGEMGGGMPEEGGQEVTVGEGETATVEVKPESKPSAP
jgi:hypothetical protein